MRFDDAHCIHMRAPNTHCLVCSQLVLTSAYKMRSTCALMKRPVVRRRLQMVYARRRRRRFIQNRQEALFKAFIYMKMQQIASLNVIQGHLCPICSSRAALSPSVSLSPGLSVFFPISISTCQSVAHLFSAIASPALSQQSVADFHHRFFFPLSCICI